MEDTLPGEVGSLGSPEESSVGVRRVCFRVCPDTALAVRQGSPELWRPSARLPISFTQVELTSLPGAPCCCRLPVLPRPPPSIDHHWSSFTAEGVAGLLGATGGLLTPAGGRPSWGWLAVTGSGVWLCVPEEELEARREETPGWGLLAPRCSGPMAKKIAPGMPRPSELRPKVVREMPGEEEREEGVEE